MTAQVATRAKQGTVLGKAVSAAADRLAITKTKLAAILGVSPASVSRLASGGFQLDPASKAGELALLFVRMYRSLDSIVGRDDAARAWLAAPNAALNGAPMDLIVRTQGLVHVVDYLDAQRARL